MAQGRKQNQDKPDMPSEQEELNLGQPEPAQAEDRFFEDLNQTPNRDDPGQINPGSDLEESL